MIVSSIRVASFRNLAPQVVELGPGMSLLWGDNGQGKTNFIEALFVLATLRSFRSSSLADLMVWGGSSARIAGCVQKAGIARVLEVTLADGRRTATADGKTVRSAAAYAGELAAVLFVPEDLGLLRGAPAARRRFLDRLVFGIEPGYLARLQAYTKLLAERNALLVAPARRDARELLPVYDDQLARHAAALYEDRRRTIAALQPLFQSVAAEILAREPVVDAVYRPSPPSMDLLAALRDGRAADLARGRTLVGPHRDDMLVSLDGREAALHASQGQTRALVLALKIAEILLVREHRGEDPVLLLDDVASELDPLRNEYLLSFLSRLGAQAFLTATRPSLLAIRAARDELHVVGGAIRRE